MNNEKIPQPRGTKSAEEPSPKEARVEDIDKAFVAAKAENPLRTVAINFKKFGMLDKAKEYNKKADEKGEEALEQYDKEVEETQEAIGRFLDEIFTNLEGSQNKKIKIPSFFRNEKGRFDMLKKFLGVAQYPYKQLKDINVRFFATNIDRVAFEANTEVIQIFSKDAWEGQKRFIEKERIERKKEDEIL